MLRPAPRALLSTLCALACGCSTLLGLDSGELDPKYLDAGRVDGDVDRDGSADAQGDVPTASASRYRAAVLEDIPEAYYPLDEAAGSTVVKSVVSGSGSEFDGSVQSAALGAPGALSSNAGGGTALRLSPAASGVHFTAQTAPSMNDPLTLEFWIRLEGAAPVARIVFNRSSGTEGYRLTVSGTDLLFERVTRSGIEALSAPSALTVGIYTHLAITYEKTLLRLYRDGVELTESPSGWTIESPAGELMLGSSDSSKPAADATIDEFAIYPAALTQARIQAHLDAAR